jgi:hypothetical protein
MAVLDHHDYPITSSRGESTQALMFCLAWVAFLAMIGATTYIVSAL